jgi:hypothetical protein
MRVVGDYCVEKTQLVLGQIFLPMRDADEDDWIDEDDFSNPFFSSSSASIQSSSSASNALIMTNINTAILQTPLY